MYKLHRLDWDLPHLLSKSGQMTLISFVRKRLSSRDIQRTFRQLLADAGRGGAWRCATRGKDTLFIQRTMYSRIK